jgi:hypothetical protein
MAIVVRYNPFIEIAGIDLSDHGKQVTVNDGQESQDASAFGGSYRVYRSGLGTPSIECVFLNDHANGSVEATLRSLIGVNSTGGSVTVRTVNGVIRSTDNPEYYMDGIIDGDLSVLDDTHGELAEITVRFVPYSTFAAYTSAT